jgi:alcohol dehydrogenase
MRGLTFEGPGSIVFRDGLPEPRVEQPTDAVIAVRASGLCGSDLHPYEGREAARRGVVPGHEAVGEVIAVGAAVSRFRTGDRVLVPFTTSCGTCAPCRRDLSARCERGQLFGWGDPDHRSAPPLHGAQAEQLRVPLADSTLVAIPSQLDDLDAVLLTDNLPTGWVAVERADVEPDAPAVVVGAGSVGLCAVWAAKELGADPVVAVDPVDVRRQRAAALGALAVTPTDAAAAIEDLDPAGVLAVIEAAGTAPAQQLAAELAAPGACLSLISVQTGDRFGFRPADAYDRNLTVRAGRAPVRSVLDRLLPRLAASSPRLPTSTIVTDPAVNLEDGPGLYRRFASRDDGLVKAVLRP